MTEAPQVWATGPKAGLAHSIPEESKTLPLDVVQHQAPVVVDALAESQNSYMRHIFYRKRYFLLSVLMLSIAGIAVSIYAQSSLKTSIFSARDKSPAISYPQKVVGLGKLFPEGEVIVIAPPFGAGDARLATLHVQDGDQVTAGTVVAVLDSERTLLAALDSARAAVAARDAMLVQARTSTEAARNEARATLARAEATAHNAIREFARVEALRQHGVAAEQAYEQRRTVRDEVQREVERAQATLSRYGLSRYGDSADIDQQPDVVVAARNLDIARSDLARATADLEKAYVRAPRNGTVLTVHIQPGEKPGSQGIMNLGDIDHMMVEIEIYQAHIGRIALGDRVEVTAEALPRPLIGQVTKIGLEVGRQLLVDVSPAASTDARVVKVTATLDAESRVLARRFTNLQVIAHITTAATSAQPAAQPSGPAAAMARP